MQVKMTKEERRIKWWDDRIEQLSRVTLWPEHCFEVTKLFLWKTGYPVDIIYDDVLKLNARIYEYPYKFTGQQVWIRNIEYKPAGAYDK